MKNVSFSSKISESIKDQLMDIKKDLSDATGSNISNQVLLEKIVQMSSAVLSSDDAVSKLLEGDFDSFKVKEPIVELEAEEPTTLKDSRKNHEISLNAIDSLISNGPRSLDSIDGLISSDQNVIQSVNNVSKEGKYLMFPGVYLMVDKDTNNVVNIVGTNNIEGSLQFVTKALKKGRANSSKSLEEIKSKYGKRYEMYEKFKNLSKFNNIRYDIIGTDAPNSTKGKIQILSAIKSNPESQYDLDEFVQSCDYKELIPLASK